MILVVYLGHGMFFIRDQCSFFFFFLEVSFSVKKDMS